MNLRGEVIGINTAILSQTGSYQGYGFAIPMELAREVIDDLIEFGEGRRALIGVSIMDVSAAALPTAFWRHIHIRAEGVVGPCACRHLMLL